MFSVVKTVVIQLKIRLLSKARQEPYWDFYKMLGFLPFNIAYYQQALRHRSVSQCGRQYPSKNNERLEFLGDTALNTIVSDVLYRRYPQADEGFLTNTRSKIVNRNSLNQLAVDIGLHKHVLLSQPINGDTNIYGNAIEALIGAIYLDRGYKTCMRFVTEKLIGGFIDLDKITEDDLNFKSRMIEWSQKNHLSLRFVLLEDSIFKNNTRKFVTQLELEGKAICQGIGKNKKQSEQEASQLALQLVETGKLEAAKFKQYSEESATASQTN